MRKYVVDLGDRWEDRQTGGDGREGVGRGEMDDADRKASGMRGETGSKSKGRSGDRENKRK